MKTRALLSAVVMSGILIFPMPRSHVMTDYNRGTEWYDRWNDNDVRPLQGRWYMNGDPNKPTDIHMNGRRLEATNENGKTTRLRRDGRGDIRASDWQGVRGDVRGNRIEWSNGTTSIVGRPIGWGMVGGMTGTRVNCKDAGMSTAIRKSSPRSTPMAEIFRRGTKTAKRVD